MGFIIIIIKNTIEGVVQNFKCTCTLVENVNYIKLYQRGSIDTIYRNLHNSYNNISKKTKIL